MTKQTTGARRGVAGAVSKHETGTVTKQTIDAVSKHETVIPVGTLKFGRSKVSNFVSASTSRFFVPWEAGGPSPNQHASATPPRIWKCTDYGANIAAGLSGQKFERSKVCIREYISLLCALGGGRSVPKSARLSNTSVNMEYTYLRSEHSGGTVRNH